MKKIIFRFLLICFIAGTVNLSAGAATMTVGASTWFTWLDETGSTSSDAPTKPFFMTGPVMSIGINQQFSFSSILLAGVAKVPVTASDEVDMIRVDSDNALSYRISKHFKLLGGIKIMHYEMEFSGIKAKTTGFGPVLGTSFTFPLGKNFFILGSFSAMYTPTKNYGDTGSNHWHNILGQNSTLSFGYFFRSINTMIALGGRYQCWASDDFDYKTWNHFSGITFTAVYSFNL